MIFLSHLVPGSIQLDRSVYVACAESSVEGKDFLTSTWRVRYVFPELVGRTYLAAHFSDTLEQIDVAKGLIEKYPDVRLVPVCSSYRDLQCFRHSATHSAQRISSNPSRRERLPVYLASRGTFFFHSHFQIC